MMKALEEPEVAWDQEDWAGIQLVELLQSMDDLPEDWVLVNRNEKTALSSVDYWGPRSIGTTEFYRVRATSDVEGKQKAIEKFGQWSDFLVQMVKRVRLSPKLRDQCGAEMIEIYLTRAYCKPEMRELLSEDFSQRAIELIADQPTRIESRRRSLLASWRARREEGINLDDSRRRFALDTRLFGGYDLQSWFDYIPVQQIPWIVDRGADAVTDQLLQMIDAGQEQKSTLPMRKELHRVMFGEQAYFEYGPYGDRLRVSAKPGDLPRHDWTIGYPGSQWFAPWESDAIRLKERLRDMNTRKAESNSPTAAEQESEVSS